jgi:CrcB protein
MPSLRDALPGDRRELGAIFVGGALGGATRSWLAVNLVGCFLLGYFVTRLQERLPITAYRRPLLGTGVCGGLTTFSTFQLELLQMLDRDQIGLVVLYGAASVGAGFLGVAVGTAIVRRAKLIW